MPKLANHMAAALSSAAAAAREQGLASDLGRPAPSNPVAGTDEESAAPLAAPTAAAPPPSDEPAPARVSFLAQPRTPPPGDLVQFGFRCPRELKRDVERYCFEAEVTLQEFGQEALRLLLAECRKAP